MTTIIKQMADCWNDPYSSLFKIIARIKPELMWHRYRQLARDNGFKTLFFILSFDCDTHQDAKVVLDLDSRLRDMGITPAYAVPGQLLEHSQNIYEKLYDRGTEFLNHGHVEHTFWNEVDAYNESCFFYDQVGLDAVKKDITDGHRTLKKILGIKPKGFRAPHFGTFQKKSQLSYIHNLLVELGYLFSSSTVPVCGLKYGPICNEFQLPEFPVSGCFSNPSHIFDSWGFFGAPDRGDGNMPQNYLYEAESMAKFINQNQTTGILNYYADPSHVYDQPAFYKTMETIVSVARSTSFEELLTINVKK